MLSFGEITTAKSNFDKYNDELEKLMAEYVPVMEIYGNGTIAIPTTTYKKMIDLLDKRDEAAQVANIRTIFTQKDKIDVEFRQLVYRTQKGLMVIVGGGHE